MVLSDNFGKIMAGIFRPPSSSVNTIGGIKATDGIDYVMAIYSSSGNNWSNVGGKYIRIGKGTTPATAQDFELEDPFVVGVEATRVASALATYQDGDGFTKQTVQFQPMGGNGDISEIIQELVMKDSTGNDRNVQISRIVIDPAVPFIINQQTNIESEISF